VSAVELPRRVEAHEPPEVRGRGRDDVAMLVATRHDGALAHARFGDLPRFLAAGDVLVVNTSATLAAAVDARLGERPLELRLSTPAPGCDEPHWIVELRSGGDLEPTAPPIGARLALPGGAAAELRASYAGGGRLALARLDLRVPIGEYLARHGRPIRYGYVPAAWPIDAYQTVFAHEPGSAEMPSAARPFTAEIVTELVARGIVLATVTLHTGVSSPERGEAPYPERYRVPAATAALVSAARGWGGRVIAVGTTVVRALETVARDDGTVVTGAGWTRLVVTPDRGLRAVDGLLTGWHEPAASHLELLEAAAGADLLRRSYAAAAAGGYRWHEFGDVHLVLP
jgi:S-adenosylmethionine:tRNA ribosyltransferase-isomerase